MEDDFNPYQTMSIASLGAASIPNQARSSEPRRVNRTEDIAGAQPKRYYRDVYNRDYFHDTKDIEGAQPRGVKEPANRPNFVNRTSDIEGAQSKPSIFKTTRVTDPLEPQYPLPKSEPLKAVRMRPLLAVVAAALHSLHRADPFGFVAGKFGQCCCSLKCLSAAITLKWMTLTAQSPQSILNGSRGKPIKL